MGKKCTVILLLVFSLLSITGCSALNKVFSDKKPTTYYYTNGLLTFYKNEGPKTITIFYSDLYKERTLNSENYLDVDNFLKSLKSENFIDKPADIPKIPLYKIYIEFDKIKYVLNVYNEKYASIYPWDGKYDMDFVDMSSVPIAYNMYGICKFYLPNE